MPVSPGTTLGAYEILALLGAGGMGEVYVARDPRLGREVAIKVLPDEVVSDADRLARFEREARAAAALNHPNVVVIHELSRDQGAPFVVMELLSGETLRRRLDRGPLRTAEALECATQVARGLAAAHSRAIVHRDLKPENLFLTRDGVVKILDFGLARLQSRSPLWGAEESESTASGIVVGTVGYLSPEQIEGGHGDARSDIFSLGIVLYEALAGRHPFRGRSGVETLAAVLRHDPAGLSDAGISRALEQIVRRCLEKDPDERFQSAHDLALALESLRSEGPARVLGVAPDRERGPYPGLSAFDEEDRASFFGREEEAAALWEKIRRHRLLALIGPSGVGKTSFLRAGLVPTRPPGWRCLLLSPGPRPVTSLGRALAPELESDPEALRDVVSFDDPDVAVSLFTRWRRRHVSTLVVVDQFEELFTLSAPEVRGRFVALLGRLTIESDVHVLLSLRDDFFFACQAHPSLKGVFEQVTPLGPLEGEALRRALVEPARRQEVRFEDDALVEEMCAVVEGERGALPLLAFCAAQLWARRDREGGVISRASFDEVGGVAGALARHAETTLATIGGAREGIVRELFRNLVTAQGTRATRDREELLSVFEDRAPAEQVLEQLVDARLLTSYQVQPGSANGESQRVEIVHESLLSQWPRLVRWQMQDVEGAKLRDELRQAAQLWDERGRSEDRLWKGTAFQEFHLWRQRYSGKLSALEEAFTDSMEAHARRRQRRRRLVTAAVVAAALATAGVTALLWRRAESAREVAALEARRAEAGTLVALARLELDRHPAAALAYARKSLEGADTPAGREIALEALWRGPTLRVLPLGGLEKRAWRGAFSPDGGWLALYPFDARVVLQPAEGGPSTSVDGFPVPTGPPGIAFTPSGDALVTSDNFRTEFRVVSFPEGQEILRFRPDAMGGSPWIQLDWRVTSEAVLAGVRDGDEGGTAARVVSWPLDGGPPRVVGVVDGGWAATDSRGTRLAFERDGGVFLRSIEGPRRPARRLGRMGEGVQWPLQFSPGGDLLAVGDQDGRLVLFPTAESPQTSPRELTMANPEEQFSPVFDASGRRLAWGSGADRSVTVWHLDDPPDAEPLVLRRPDAGDTKQALFHPVADWLAVMNGETVGFWAVGQPRVRVIRRHRAGIRRLVFSPDGRWLLSCAPDGIGYWPMFPGRPPQEGLLVEEYCYGGPALSPDGRRMLFGKPGGVSVVSLPDGNVRSLDPEQPQPAVSTAAFDPSGRRAATATTYSEEEDKVLRIWDLEAGTFRSFSLVPPGEPEYDFYDWGVWGLVWTPDESLIAGGLGGVRRIDPDTGEMEWLWRADRKQQVYMHISGNGRWMQLGGPRLQPDGTVRPEGILYDLAEGTERSVSLPVSDVTAFALGDSGEVMVAGDVAGAVRVFHRDDQEPHLLLRHDGAVSAVAVSPDGQWVASASGGEIRLWPMAELSATPLQARPHAELLTTLESLTNLQVVEDPTSSTGYRLETGPFPGWEDAPTWWPTSR
jgi:WD40 repeat protein